MQIMQFDMNSEFPGRADMLSFPEKISGHDFTPWSGKHVQLRGCAPTWAHLLVAAQLLPIVGQLDFMIDDGGEGKVVPISMADNA